MRISMATCLNIPEPDEDQQPLLDALAARGATVTIDAWDDPDAQGHFDDADIITIRSTWNSYLDPEGFVDPYTDDIFHGRVDPIPASALLGSGPRWSQRDRKPS